MIRMIRAFRPTHTHTHTHTHGWPCLGILGFREPTPQLHKPLLHSGLHLQGSSEIAQRSVQLPNLQERGKDARGAALPKAPGEAFL